MRILLCRSFILLAASIMLNGQATSVARVAGTIRDQSGLAISGAKVSITQTDTGVVRSTESGADGAYVLPNLPVGPYTLQVTKEGFSAYVQSGIVLQVDTNPEINVTMTVGSVSERIVVEANAATVETFNTSIGQVIDRARVVDLPLNGRQVSQLIALSGAAVAATPGNAGGAIISNKNYPTVAAFSVAGGQPNQTIFYLDGGFNMDTLTNVGLPMPFPDALQEFKVETSSLPANYGTEPGGVVNVVTKSGGNAFHGGLFEFYRNYNFNARNFFAPTRDSLKRHQFGGELGGPIIKDKLFFFGGYQGTFESTAPATNIVFVETPATLQGDFTAITSPACNGGRSIRLSAPFVNNMIPASQLNPVALKALSYIPVSSDPCGKLVYGIPSKDHENQFTSKVDWQESNVHSLFVRYFVTDYEHPPYYNGNVLTIVNDPNVGLRDRVQSAVIGDTFLFGPSTINSFHASFTRSAIHRYLPSNYPTVTQLGANVTEQTPNWINVQVPNYFSFACTNCNPGPWVTNSYQLSEDLNLIRGGHQLAVGVNWIYTQLNGYSTFQRNGVFMFTGNITGNALADFELGRPVSFLQSRGQFEYNRIQIPSLYAQDNWKITSRFNVNLGLRWDPFIPSHHKQHLVGIFDPARFYNGLHSTVFPNAPAGLFFTGDSGYPDSSNTYGKLLNISPRVGIVADPRGKGQESIRAGYGIFYSTNALFIDGTIPADPPYGSGVTLTAPAGGLSNPWLGFPGGNPFPAPFPPPSTYVFPTSGTYATMPVHTKPEYVQQWNFAVQKQLSGWLVSANYIGNKTTHLWLGRNINPAVYIPGTCAAGQYGLTAPGPCSTVGNTQARRFLTLLNPSQGVYYGAITQVDDGANANYNGLLLSTQHRFSHNFTALVNYTLSHCIDNGDIQQNIASYYQDPNNRNGTRGPCASDRRHIFNTSVVVASPKYSLRWLDRIAGGWQLSGIFTAQTGAYLTVTDGTDVSLTGVGLDRPNVVGNVSVANPTLSQWFNTAAFVRQPTGTFGNAGVGIIEGPGQWNLDMALSRNFSVRERHTIAFRAEAFNLLNHARFGNPATALNSAIFGVINTASDPRIMQFALKYAF